jgi:hypothetical protein
MKPRQETDATARDDKSRKRTAAASTVQPANDGVTA